MDHLSQNLPLLQSCNTETLRIGTSVFSIRDVEQPLPLKTRNKAEVVIPPKSRVICATRASHLDQATWGDEAHKWDGRRFFDEDADEESEKKSTRAREVWGFGGGISRVSFIILYLAISTVSHLTKLCCISAKGIN